MKRFKFWLLGKKLILGYILFCALPLCNLFANEAVFELLQNKFGLANMPICIEYERVVEGADIDAKKQVLYTPNAKCKVFADGKGCFLYSINRLYPKNAKDASDSQYVYYISPSEKLRYIPNRDLVEFVDFDLNNGRDPFLFSYLSAFSDTQKMGVNFVDIKNLILNAGNSDISYTAKNGSAVLTIRKYKNKSPDKIFDVYDLYRLYLKEIFGKIYPVRATTSLLSIGKDKREIELPVISEILYSEYKQIEGANISIPHKIVVNLYAINKSANGDTYNAKLYASEIVRINKIITDKAVISKNMTLEIPESATVFDLKRNSVYQMSQLAKKLEKALK